MTEVTLSKDGSTTVSLEVISKVTVDSITDVLAHRIMREGDQVIHEMEFINDGTCRLAYKETGELIEFSCNHMSMSTTKEGIVTLKRFGSASE
jgi:hypothetical protein